MNTVRRILEGEPPRNVLAEQLTSSDLGSGTGGLLGAGRFVSPFSEPEDLITTVFQLTEDTKFGDPGQRLRVQGVVDGEEQLRLKNMETDEEFDVSLDTIRNLMENGTLL